MLRKRENMSEHFVECRSCRFRGNPSNRRPALSPPNR